MNLLGGNSGDGTLARRVVEYADHEGRRSCVAAKDAALKTAQLTAHAAQGR
jgi:hypothetical protein